MGALNSGYFWDGSMLHAVVTIIYKNIDIGYNVFYLWFNDLFEFLVMVLVPYHVNPLVNDSKANFAT